MPFLVFFSALLQFSTPDLPCKMLYHAFARSTQINTPHSCQLTKLHTLTMQSTMANSARFAGIPQYFEQQSKLAMQRCSRCYGRYRVVALRKYNLLEIPVEEEIGSGSSQHRPAQPKVSSLSSLRFWTFAAESVISLPSEVASGSFLRLLKFFPVFKFVSVLCTWLCFDTQSVSSARKIVIVAGHRALVQSLCPHGSRSWSDFSQRKASALSSSTLQISRRLLFSGVFNCSVTAQQKLVRTKGYPCTCCSRYCPRISSLLAKAGRDLARSLSIF